MNTQTSIEAWASRYPNRFKIGRCTAGSISPSCTSPDAEGTSLVTLGRKSPDDVPVILTIWVADDASHAFAVQTDEDNHNMPNEELIFNEATSEADLITAIGESVGEFCRRYGVLEESLASSQWGQES